MLKIITIVGARPQFIKAAVFSRLIRSEQFKDKICEILVHTGQHYDENMSDIFFKEMEIPKPDYHLGIGSLSHGAMTGAMLEKIEKLLLKEKPDCVLVYGDTNSTLAGALAASKLLIPVAHIEAGLRSFMMVMPEEQNRRLTDHLSTFLFCPTEFAVKNLEKEGIFSVFFENYSAKDRYKKNKDDIKENLNDNLKNNSDKNSENDLQDNLKKNAKIFNKTTPDADNKLVSLCGDIMHEASLYYREKVKKYNSKLIERLPANFFLLTIHRQENTDNLERISSIFSAINKIKNHEVVFPVHPRTRKIIEKMGIKFESHIHCIDPVGYLDMILLEDKCDFIVTDSGGVQKEAYFFKKPCITLRDTTEWIELVENGWNTLTGADEGKIIEAINNMPKYGTNVDLYGDGVVAEKIASTLFKYL